MANEFPSTPEMFNREGDYLRQAGFDEPPMDRERRQEFCSYKGWDRPAEPAGLRVLPEVFLPQLREELMGAATRLLDGESSLPDNGISTGETE